MSDETQNAYTVDPSEDVDLSQVGTEAPVRIPKDGYRVTVLSAQFLLSAKKKTPYFELDCELRENPMITYKGEPLDVNGTRGRLQVYLTPKNGERIAKAFRAANVPLGKLSEVLASPGTYAQAFVGKSFRAICESVPTQETREDGSPILDNDGQPIVKYFFSINEVI